MCANIPLRGVRYNEREKNRKLGRWDRIKDVRANCFCASLLRTQMHTPRPYTSE